MENFDRYHHQSVGFQFTISVCSKHSRSRNKGVQAFVFMQGVARQISCPKCAILCVDWPTSIITALVLLFNAPHFIRAGKGK